MVAFGLFVNFPRVEFVAVAAVVVAVAAVSGEAAPVVEVN